MKNTLFFEHKSNYLTHEEMQSMIETDESGKLFEVAKNISVCLHEDWRQNLINEKGKAYQHFRDVKDEEMNDRILANREDYLDIKTADGKNVYQIVTEVKGGKTIEKVQFDLMRMPFEHLSEYWQNANLEAAKFSLCLVKTCIEQGCFQGNQQEVFEAFEKMSHDVHIEWMTREGKWADVRLLVPYEQLLVKSKSNNEKDKDRAHVSSTAKELTFQPNILARNRSIVVRAIKELFKSNAIESGLNPEIMKKLTEITGLVEEQNNSDFARYSSFKTAVKSKIEKVFENKQELEFNDLEKASEIYYTYWKEQAKEVGVLPQEYESSYANLAVDDERVNIKNFARKDIADLIKEMVSEKSLDESFLNGANIVLGGDLESELGQKIQAKNQEDFANYQALVQSQQNGMQ